MELSTNFDDIKTLLRELVESQKETDRKFRKTDRKFKETDRKFKETDEQLNKRFEETGRRLRETTQLFETQWGKLMESLVEGDLVHLLRSRDIDVEETATRYKGKHRDRQFEFDILAFDGDEIVIVEVKTTLRVKHVREFLKELDRVKEWIPRFKGLKIHGAVAFLRTEEESEVFAEKNRLWVIRATGDSARIANPVNFKPKIW